MDSAGDFVVAWESGGEDGSGYGVFAQAYKAVGALGERVPGQDVYRRQSAAPSVAMDSAGGFVVAWQRVRSRAPRPRTAAKTASTRNSTAPAARPEGASSRSTPTPPATRTIRRVAMDAAGDFVVTWQSPEDGGPTPEKWRPYGVYAQAFNASGRAQGSEFQVNTYTPGSQGQSAVARDSAGDFVVAWQSQYQDGSQQGVYAKRYEPAVITTTASASV